MLFFKEKGKFANVTFQMLDSEKNCPKRKKGNFGIEKKTIPFFNLRYFLNTK